MVNRLFMHKDYESIKPTYHCIIDNKLLDGTWPIHYLNIIHEKNPNVTLILNANWFYSEKFNEIKKKARIIWAQSRSINPLFPYKTRFDLTTRSSGYYVVEQCIASSIYMGFSDIYLLGYEGHGIAKRMLNLDTHFSGKDPNFAHDQPIDIARSLHCVAQHIITMYSFVDYCNKNRINLVNLTNDGIMNMISCGDIAELFDSSCYGN